MWPFKKRVDPELLIRLEEAAVKRIQAQNEMDQRRQEVELRKLELEAQYAEHLTKAKILDKDAALERRQKAKEWGKAGKIAQKARYAADAAIPKCNVCAKILLARPSRRGRLNGITPGILRISHRPYLANGSYR